MACFGTVGGPEVVVLESRSCHIVEVSFGLVSNPPRHANVAFIVWWVSLLSEAVVAMPVVNRAFG